MKRLTKSKDRKLAGVCGGIAEYFNVDPSLVRIAWALVSACYGAGIIAYIVAALVLPEAE